MACGLGLTGLPPAPASAAEATTLRFEEVFQLLKANLAGATEAELNRAAALGLIEQLSPRVQLFEEGSRPPTNAAGPAVATQAFDRAYGYVRVGNLNSATAREFQAAIDGLASTNKLKGLVLDLRFATGQDYGSAVAVADRFFSEETPMVDWGEGVRKSTAKTNAIAMPVSVLVNRKTAGAAEVLAGVLRSAGLALIVGTNTAGQASVTREFPLQSGQRLRVAVAPVKVAGGQELPFSGIKADIEVGVSPEEELAFFEDAYWISPKQALALASAGTNDLSSTNRSPRRRLNEAELVRMSREGIEPRDPGSSPPAPARPAEAPAAQVTDPALARALDILKGLAVVQRFRAP